MAALKIAFASGFWVRYSQFELPHTCSKAVSPVVTLYNNCSHARQSGTSVTKSAQSRSELGTPVRSSSASGVRPKQPRSSSANTPKLARARSNR